MADAIQVTGAILPFLLLFGLAALAPTIARRCRPRLAATLLTACSLVAALAVGAVLSVVAFLLFATTDLGSELLHVSPVTLTHHDVVPQPLAMVAAVVAVVSFAAGAFRGGAALTRLVQSCLVTRAMPSRDLRLVIVDDGPPAAFAVPGLPGRAVVTTSLLHELSAEERAIVLAHEASHITHHHEIYAELTRIAATANPLLRRAVPAVELAVERWADEDSLQVASSRESVARTLARVGLLTMSTHPTHGALAVADTDLRLRVDALRFDRPTRSRTVLAAGAGLASVLAAAGAVQLALWGHDLIEQAQATIGYFD